MKIAKSILIIVVTFITLIAEATPVADLSFYIPLESIRPPATDLYYDGRVLFPNEARALRDQGVDLSLLDPDPTTDLWSPTGFPPEDDIPVENGDTVRYLELVHTPLKLFRFNILKRHNDGIERMYTILVGKRTQTLLLRKALLEKLGYRVPAMKRLAKLTVQFKTSIEKENFVEDRISGLRWHADGAEQWITNLGDKDSKELHFQDVLVLNPSEDFTNLAIGIIRPDLTRGRRLINALIVPYALADVRESVNGFRWHAGNIRSNAVYLGLEDDEQFSTPIEDARWILRRLQNLTREDFEDVVAAAEYPTAPAKLLVEKLIARRNNLFKLFQMEVPALSYNPMVNHGDELINGELTKGDYDGFGARLAMGEEESPVSPKELKALFKSKFVSTTISELVQRVNTDLVPRTDLEKKFMERRRKEILKDLAHFIQTGEPRDVDFGTWSEPFLNGRLLASREVVSGSYLGTDNRIQLVDTFGYGVETGMYIGTLGLSPGEMIDAQGVAYYVRQFSHLRPLQSIDAALKEPYKNILIPLIKRDIASVIPRSFDEFDEMEEEERVKKAQEIAQLFKDELGDGESIIITDSIGGLGSIRFGREINERVQAQAALKASLMHLSRLHILRRGDSLHVYKDRGNIRSLEYLVTIRAEIELLSIRGTVSKGKAYTDFYSLDITNDMNENPDLLLNLSAIRQLLIDNKVNRLRAIANPHTLEHEFKEKQGEMNFLRWNRLRLKTYDQVKVTRATEEDAEFYMRYYAGKRRGMDLQSLSVDLLNHFIAESTGESIEISNTTSGDSGDNLFGKSYARYSYFEAEVDRSGPTDSFMEQFVGVVYRWKGWSAKKEKVQKIVRQFSERFNFEFYDENAFHLLEKAELYTLSLRIFVYQTGLDVMLNLPDSEVRRIFAEHYAKRAGTNGRYLVEDTERFLADRNFYQKFVSEGDTTKAARSLTNAISVLEESVDKDGFLKIMGGEKNVLITTDLQGFLKGEDGSYAKMPIEGNQIGQVASRRSLGPLSTLQAELGMTESEFFINWLLRKL